MNPEASDRGGQLTTPRPKRRLSRRACVLLGLFALIPAGYIAALVFSMQLLRLESPATTADAIVLLGGDRLHRPPRAAELFHQQAAPEIIISGEGDCEVMQAALVADGVPKEAIKLEPDSRNTSENARFSIRLLREQHAKRVIIVTSWFHSRRALKCFRHYAPELEFISRPTVADLPHSCWPNRRERHWVLTEYPKVVWYWIRYGIAPF